MTGAERPGARRARERAAARKRRAAGRRPEIAVPPPAPGARRVDIARWDRIELFLGGVLPLLLGAGAEIAAIADLTYPPHSTAVRVVLAILGVPFLGVGIGLWGWLLRRPPRWFLDVDDTDGLTVHGRRGVEWHLAWPDVSRVRVVRTRAKLTLHQSNRGGYLTGMLPRYWLAVEVSAGAASRADIERQLDAPQAHGRTFTVQLGGPRRLTRDVLAALGRHADPARIVRLDTADPVPRRP